MTLPRPRATGFYATFEGREFHATPSGASLVLRSYVGEPPADGFAPSQIPSVAGVRTVDRAAVEKLTFVRTVCTWRGEPFMVVAVEGNTLYAFYTGTRGEWAAAQPEMTRTGKLETCGRLSMADVEELYEFVNPLQ